LIWLPLAVIADLLIWFLLYPHLPPGRMSTSAQHQQFDWAFMALLCAPVLLFVWTYAAYALVNWHHREGDEEDGPLIHGNAKIQATWIGVTAVIVLGLFVFGTVELIVPAGAGAGEGPAPIWKPSSSNLLQVQVIGQQWAFSYRYPQFGGMETTELVLPDNRAVQFNVTSLDVIHSFWAYQLGVKADANPGVNNVAFTTPQQLGHFIVRCNELCGLWHGAMFNTGYVVTPVAFAKWAAATQAKEANDGILAALPPYATTYDPTVVPQLGAPLVKIVGVTGAPGYYYPPQDPVTP
jgi:cytochrome c oxidase subunit 2